MYQLIICTSGLYFRRKQVGILATAHWKNSFPKFNTPEKRLELAEFASSIADECSVPAAGFNKEGIVKHIQDYFNEQRRYNKRRKLVYGLKLSNK